MKSTNKIPETLVKDVAANVSKHKSPKAIIKAVCSLVVAAAAGAATLFGGMEEQSWGPMCLGSIAIIALIMVFVYLFGSKPEYKYNGSTIRGYEVFFTNPSVSAIRTAIRDKDVKTLRTAINTSDNGLRMNVAISDDNSMKRMQFYKYEPFEYKPESEIIEIDAETAEFIEKL